MEKWLLNKNKGFTLVELLAIIVILAIIALITVPIITNIVKESEKNALKETGREIIRAGETYRTMSQVKGNQLNGCVYFDFSLSIENETIIDEKKYVPLKELNLQGKLPNKGNLEVCSDTINLNAGNGKYIVTGTKIDDVQVIEGDSETTDTTAPIINQIVLNSTTNSIQVIISAHEEEGTIEKYLYSIDGINYIEKDINTYTFENLENNKEYTIYIKVINKVGLEVSEEKNTKTKEVDKPVISFTNTPNEVQNGYLKEQIAKVTFSSTNVTNPQYYIKTTREGISSVGVTSSCGNSTNPGNCSNISSTTTLTPNTWYKVNGNINVTYNKQSTETGTIYAITYDGTNYSEASTASISKIDKTSPTVTLGTVTSTTNSIIIPITKMEDIHSGISAYTCKYGESSGTYNKNANSVSTTNCTITGLITGKTYYYEVCASDKVGNNATCKTGNLTMGIITKPTITLVNTPTEPQNGYLKEQTAKVTFSSANVTNPSYYIKTTREGISSVGVTSSCGTGTNPGNCSNISSTTTLSVGTWYKVNGNINVTYNTHSTETGTIYAITYDGTNYSSATTGSISKIDKKGPTFTTSVSNNIVTITASDNNQSGLHSYAFSCNGSWQSSNICTFNTSGNYTINVRDVLENVGTSKTVTITIKNPVASKNPSGVTSYTNSTKHEMFEFTHPSTTQVTNSKYLTDYRYIGNDPYNYVIFNNETWRIIGYFWVYNGTTWQQRYKLVRNESIGINNWDTNNQNDWTKSTLQTYLNGTYYNSLTTTAKNQIENATYYLGGTSNGIQSAPNWYAIERGTTVYGTNSTNWTGKIGLMYPSDYTYTYANGIDNTCFTESYNCDTSNPSSGWMYMESIVEWMITHSITNGSNRGALFAYWSDNGTPKAWYGGVHDNDATRPVVYLKSSIKITGGTGQKTNPYILSN